MLHFLCSQIAGGSGGGASGGGGTATSAATATTATAAAAAAPAHFRRLACQIGHGALHIETISKSGHMRSSCSTSERLTQSTKQTTQYACYDIKSENKFNSPTKLDLAVCPFSSLHLAKENTHCGGFLFVSSPFWSVLVPCADENKYRFHVRQSPALSTLKRYVRRPLRPAIPGSSQIITSALAGHLEIDITMATSSSGVGVSTNEDFCLKWNDHHSTFFNSAEALCQNNALTDVTLSCGTGAEFAAHKLVLSVCSTYFHHLFASGASTHHLDTRHAIVYLKDIDARHMELLLSYMYRGEINVQEQELMGLLATAKSLQIKGLTESGENKANNTSASSSVPPSSSSSPADATTTPSAKTRSKHHHQKPHLATSQNKRSAAANSDGGDAPDGKKIKEESAASAAAAAVMSSGGGGASNDGGGGGQQEQYEEYGEDYEDDEDDDYPVPEGGGPAIYEDEDDDEEEQGDQNLATVRNINNNPIISCRARTSQQDVLFRKR